jgi:hypothetical protein
MSKKSKVTLTNVEIANANAALNALSGVVTDIVLAFRIVQNAKPLAEIADSYKTARRDTIVNSAGVTVEAEKVKFDTPENEALANASLKTLAEIETEVEYYPLSLSRLASTNVTLDYGLIIPLQWMIADDVE